jgi:recombination protein RecA
MKKKRRSQVSTAAAIASQINSAMGKPVLRLGSDEDFIPIKVPTGSLVIDRVTGGGFTLGRHVELFGSENACKSFIAQKTMALSQYRGNLCALVDPEKTFDPTWFEHLGGIPNELLLFQPEEKWTAEDAIGVMMLLAQLIEDESIEIITIDSVAAMVTQEEMRKDPREEDRIASQARMMSRALRRITTVNKRTLFIWINQQRTNIGYGAQFNPRVESGGRALKFYATTRIELQQAGRATKTGKVAEKSKVVEKKVPWGTWVQVRSQKDKSTKPYGQGQFIFDNRKGEIDFPSEIIHLGLEDEIIKRVGNTFSYEDVGGETWKGTEVQFRKLIEKENDLHEELIAEISDMTIQLSRLDSG